MVQLAIIVLALAESDDSASQELAKKIKNGDQKALKTFFDAHHQSLFRYLIGKGISKDIAQDLIQQAFVYIWEHRSKIDPSKSLRAYLFKIGYTRMLNHIRDHKKFNPANDIPVRPSEKNPLDHIQNKELKEAIDKAVEQMPEKRKMVFEMCFIQEFTYKETARALNLSVKTIENHMALALKDMRKALKSFMPDK